MKILVTGGGGQLGYHLGLALTDHHVISLNHKQLDVTDYPVVTSAIKGAKPEIVIHAAAFTNVDGCEQNEEKAYLANTIGTRNVALASRNVGARLVYLSTDFVFDGAKDSPYLPSDEPNPLNVYGRTKLAGENLVSCLFNEFFIVRTSWLFGDLGSNFVRTILKLAKEKAELAIVDDQIGSPTYAKDLAEVIASLILTDCYGTYQVSNRGAVSWFEFALEIASQCGIRKTIKPISSQELARPAKRPAYSVMSTLDVEHLLGLRMRDFREALRDFLENSKRLAGTCGEPVR